MRISILVIVIIGFLCVIRLVWVEAEYTSENCLAGHYDIQMIMMPVYDTPTQFHMMILPQPIFICDKWKDTE